MLPSDFSDLPGMVLAPKAMRKGLAAVPFSSELNRVRFTRCWLSKPAEDLFIAFTWHAVCTTFVLNEKAADGASLPL